MSEETKQRGALRAFPAQPVPCARSPSRAGGSAGRLFDVSGDELRLGRSSSRLLAVPLQRRFQPAFLVPRLAVSSVNGACQLRPAPSARHRGTETPPQHTPQRSSSSALRPPRNLSGLRPPAPRPRGPFHARSASPRAPPRPT